MSKISSLSFIALDISGKNYLSWVLDAEINLEAGNLGETKAIGDKNYDLLNYIEYNCGCRQIGNGILISSSEHELYVLT